MVNLHWDKEEFEDFVERSLIALYENRSRLYKKAAIPQNRMKKDEYDYVKRFGLYFSAKDRLWAVSNNIDIINDGLPFRSCVSMFIDQKNTESVIYDNYLDGFLRGHWLFKWKNENPPKGWEKSKQGLLYVLYSMYFRNEGGVVGNRHFVTINKYTGEVNSCLRPVQGFDGFRHRKEYVENMGSENINESDIMEKLSSATAGFWADRKYTWNVSAFEDKHKKTMFGVYEEQIQSLFYARDLPQTETGRKRPILHWVKAHRRRIQRGTVVDVKKHLKGVSKFEMNGTVFEITSPIKKAVENARENT